MKLPVRWVLAALVTSFAIAAACGTSQPASQRPVVVQPGSSAAPPSPPPEGRVANASTNIIACGKQACNATSEICCGFSDVFGCAPRMPVVESNLIEDRLASNLDSCKKSVKSEYSFDTLIFCDDSTDCAEGQVCCSQWLWSGASLLACIPASATGESVCDYGERCAADSCMTRDTKCRDGECRLASAKVKCAGVVCADDAPVCCLRDMEGLPKCERACKAADEDSRAVEYECSGPAGCPPGTTCQAGLFGSYCAKEIDSANAVILCESQSDCPKDACESMGGKGPTVCAESHSKGFTNCGCQ